VAGDWNGDGLSSVGVFFSPNTAVILTNASVGTPMADYQFTFGVEDAGARPLAGDWDGDGKSGFGVFYPGTGHFDLKETLGPGSADHSIDTTHSGAGVWPVAGDWSGCGRATVGVFDQGARKFFLLDANTTGAKETIYDAPNLDGLLPVAGAWSP